MDMQIDEAGQQISALRQRHQRAGRLVDALLRLIMAVITPQHRQNSAILPDRDQRIVEDIDTAARHHMKARG